MRRTLHASTGRIANARGVPGTLGGLARTLDDGRLVLLTAHHVLFGANARPNDRVWRVMGSDDAPRFQAVGRVLYGRAGIVRHGDADVHVDCAVAAVDAVHPLAAMGGRDEMCTVAHTAPGERVSKHGAATGFTEGVVVDTTHCDRIRTDGRELAAPGQILVRPLTSGGFSAEGDSGAFLRNADGAVVGLLWGVTARGEGVACPIAAVLWVLQLRLLNVSPARRTTARPDIEPSRAMTT